METRLLARDSVGAHISLKLSQLLWTKQNKTTMSRGGKALVDSMLDSSDDEGRGAAASAQPAEGVGRASVTEWNWGGVNTYNI